MRIVFLNPVGVIGGAERVLLDYLASLKSANPALELFLVVGAEGPLVAQATHLGVRVIVAAIPDALARVGDSAGIGHRSRVSRWRWIPAGIATLRYARTLRRVIRELRPEIIHSNGIKMHLLARLAVGKRYPVIWHIHDFLSERPLMRRVLQRARTGLCGAIAISQAVARDASLVLPGIPVIVIPNAVDTDRFGPSGGADLDRLAGIAPAPQGTLRIGLVATYARWKGQEILLRAAAILLRRHSEIPLRFYIVGGPIYQTAGSQFSEAELRGLAQTLGIETQVGLIPFQSDPAGIYNALDVVVHASTRAEPFGLTIAEAMACGRAVVISAGGGAAELFTPGHDALGHEPGNVEQLADAITMLALDPELRKRLGQAARKTALTRFHRSRLGPQLIASYEQFLAQRNAR